MSATVFKKNGSPQERLPPNSPEAEAGVLGCLLTDAESHISECASILSADSMYDLRHRAIFQGLLEMHDERVPIDLLTVVNWLRYRGNLDTAGGLAYLSTLPDQVPSAANVAYYSKIVADKHRLRTIIQRSSAIISKAYEADATTEIDGAIDEAEQAILKMGDGAAGVKNLPRMVELMGRAVQTIESLHQNQGILTGLSTGFADLDKMTSGLQNGEMAVIAARPGTGKTSIAIQIAENAAVEDKIPVGVFSLEMTADSLAIRLLCSRARVNIRSIRDGFLADRDFPRLVGASAKLAAAPLFIDDSSALSIFQLRTRARRMAFLHGIRLFVIDYIQLLHSTNHKADNRQQEIADISRGIKALAKELNLPIIAISQLNREVERDGGKRRPRLADLRESGAIEQDADLVGLLYKPTVKGKDEDDGLEGDCIPVNLLIAKQRSGPTGEIPLTFFRCYTRFESAAKISDESSLPYNDP